MYLRHVWASRVHGIQQAIDYDQAISIYEDVFGAENVGVFLFEDLKENLEEFARSVYEFVGLDPDRADFSKGMGARSASERGDGAPKADGATFEARISENALQYLARRLVFEIRPRTSGSLGTQNRSIRR